MQCEGVDAVLDNLQEAGVSAVSAAPYVAEPAVPETSDRREPPDDGNRGMVRIVDRAL